MKMWSPALLHYGGRITASDPTLHRALMEEFPGFQAKLLLYPYSIIVQETKYKTNHSILFVIYTLNKNFFKKMA